MKQIKYRQDLETQIKQHNNQSNQMRQFTMDKGDNEIDTMVKDIRKSTNLDTINRMSKKK